MKALRKISLLAAGAALSAAFAVGTAGAATVTATASTGVVPGFGVNIGPATWLDAPATVAGDLGGQYRSPVGDGTTQYFTVGTPTIASSASPAVLSVAATNTFTMLWGSIDSYNAVLFSNGTSNDLVTGETIRTALDPDGTSGATNAIVNFVTSFNFTTVSFFSNFGGTENPPTGPDQAAFEFQLGVVPLPAGAFLLLTAFGGLALARRRKTV